MKILILFLLALSCWAQTNISVEPHVISAILDFDAPDAGENCAIDLTYRETAPLTPDWTNIIFWSDRTRYPNLSVAGRGSIHRKKVLGDWNLLRAADGYEKQLVLLPSSHKIYGRITCGVRSPVAFEFRTKPYPMGFTYQHRQFSDPLNAGSVALPSARWDIPNFEWVNQFGNVERMVGGPGIHTTGGIFTAYGFQQTVTAGDPVPLGGGAWNAPAGSLGSNDGSYAIYDGTSQEKLYVPAAPNTAAGNTLDWARVTLTGCSGTASPVTLNVCLTDDGTGCTGNTKTRTFPLPAGSFSSCTSGGTSYTQPTTQPARFDMWQNEQFIKPSNGGFLVWASTADPTRVLLNVASVQYQRSTTTGAYEGGFAHMFSPIPVAGTPEKYHVYMTGNGNYPTVWLYTPKTNSTEFLGIVDSSGSYPATISSNSATWSHFLPGFIYATSNLGTNGAGEHVTGLDFMAVGTTPAAANAFASIGRAPAIPNIREKVKAFYLANQAHYQGLVDITQYSPSIIIESIVSYRDPATGKDYDHVVMSLRDGGQDGYQWTFVAQVDPGYNDTDSPDTKIVALMSPHGSPKSLASPIHSIFVGRGGMHHINIIGASPKDGPASPMRVVVTGGNLTASGGTTLEVESYCAGSGNYLPCSPYNGHSHLDFVPGVLLMSDTYPNIECVYVNSSSYNATTHRYTLNVNREWCTDGDQNPADPLNYYLLPKKDWTVGMQAVMRPSYVGRPAFAGRNFGMHLMWDHIKDPFGENLKRARYGSTSHDYMSMNYVGGGGGSYIKSGIGTFAADELPESGSNVAANVRRPRWAGTYPQQSDGNGAETHPSRAQDRCTGMVCDFEYDVLPFLGGGGEATTVVSVTSTGQSNLYRLTNMNGPGTGEYVIKPNYKGNGFMWLQGVKNMRDISGPGSTISDANPFCYCYAYRAGECIPTSTVGQLFAVMPPSPNPSNPHVGGLNTETLNCQGAEFSKFYNDTCAYNSVVSFDVAMRIGNIRQAGGVGNNGDSAPTPTSNWGADFIQPLSTYDRQPKEKGAYTNTRTDPTGTAILAASFRGFQGYATMVKLPPAQTFDYARRDEPVPFDVKIHVPANMTAAHNAVVEFGYEPGLRCVGQMTDLTWDGRNEVCVKGTQPIQWYDQVSKVYVGSDPGKNFDFAGDSVTGVSCTAGSSCTVTIPVIPLRTVYYRYKLRDVSNNVLFTSHACTSEQDCMVTIQ